MRGALLLLMVAVVSLSLVALGQHPHEPGNPGLVILHDVPDDGATFVGNTVQFGYIVLDEGKPTVHKDGKIRIIHNDVVLYDTHTTASAHDYDGLNMATVTFTTPGPYEIQAEVPSDGGTREASFKGYVHPIAAETLDARIAVEETGGQGSCRSFTVSVQDAVGRLVNHTDAIVEIRGAEDDRLLFRTHVHTHAAPMDFSYDFENAGRYLMRVIGHQAFPSKSAAQFASLVETLTIDIGNENGAGSSCSALPAPSIGTTEGMSGAGYELYATYDPADQVYPFGNIRLNGVVLDAESRLPVPHVDFTAELRRVDDSGVLFTSQSLHEYDGVYELVYTPLESGEYELELTAHRGEWTQSETLTFMVLPAGLPLAAGPGIVEVTGLDAAQTGESASVEFYTRTVVGTPIMHSEVDFQIRAMDRGGPVVLQNKLHTHSDGRMGFDVEFAEPGRYVLVLDPETLNGEPVTSFHINSLDGGLAMPFKVSPGGDVAAGPLDSGQSVESGDDPEVASLGGVAALVALCVVVAVRRRV